MARLYCGTYAKYNSGSIRGSWLDMEDYEDADEFFEACAKLHADESDPEFMFQDYEDFPDSLYSESMGGSKIELIIQYAKLDSDQRDIVDDFEEATGYSLSDYTIEEIEDFKVFELERYSILSDEEQIGYHYAENIGDIPEHLEPYFDYEKYGREMSQGLSVGDQYVFQLN